MLSRKVILWKASWARLLSSEIPNVQAGDLPAQFLPNPGLKLHVLNQIRHQELGPIYRENVGPDSNIVWIGCGSMVQEVFQQEGPHPVNLIPRAWTLYNEKYGVDRGIFFKQSQEWANWRRRLNPVFFKASPGFWGLTDPVTGRMVEALIGHKGPLEAILKRWAVESTLTMLFGDAYGSSGFDIDSFIGFSSQIFEESALLQLTSAEMEAKNETELWQRFTQAVHGSLSMTTELTRDISPLCQNGLVPILAQTCNFTEVEIGQLASDLVIASQDTVSNTALWMIHLLALHPDVVERYRNEANSKRYIQHVLKETTRLFPVATFLTRITPKVIHVGSYTLPKDQMILISLYHMGRRPDYFPQPHLFWPERWDRESPQEKVGVAPAGRFAHLPFGFGARSCLARHLAEYQLHQLAQILLSDFDMVSKSAELEMIMKMTGIPDQPLHIAFSPRKRRLNKE